MKDLEKNSSNYKVLVSIDNFYIKGFVYYDDQVVSSKKIPIPQEFFIPTFERSLFIIDFIKIVKNLQSINLSDASIEIYTSLDFFKKDFLKITDKLFIINQKYMNSISKYFSDKFDNIPCFIVNISRDSIFISGSLPFSSKLTSYDYLYDQIFRIKDFSQFSILNGKIKKYNLYNTISRFSLSFRHELFLPIISTMCKTLLSSFKFEEDGQIPIFILTGDMYQFLSDTQYSVFSLLYGLSLKGVVSIYSDNSNILQLLLSINDSYAFSYINHLSDVFNINFDENSSSGLTIPIKIVDSESVKEIIVERNDFVSIPIKGKAHITVHLPKEAFVGEKRGDIEMISQSNIVIDTRDRDKLSVYDVSRWIENSQDLVF
jgi:hypothetical protein